MNTEYDFDEDAEFTDGEKKEIMAEINLLFSLLQGTVPMARWFGLSPEILDMGMIDGGNAISAEVIEKIEDMDDRISVTQCILKHDMNGITSVQLSLERNNAA